MIENLKELYKFRTLIWALAQRQLSLRYRGSLLGFLWSFLNPLCLMLVYTLVFKYYIRFDQVENYTIFLFCGLLPWIWFSSGLIEGVSSIVNSGHLITKSMFPAQVLPMVSVITGAVNFILSLPLLFLFMWYFGVAFHWTLVFLPVLVIAQFFLLYGLALALGAVNVHFRDMQHIIGNLLTFLFFLCPIIYPVSSVPERFRPTMELNPPALLTSFYHNIVIDGVLPAAGPVAYLGACVLVVMLVGNMIYSHYRESFAELL